MSELFPREEFEKIVAEEYAHVPARFVRLIENVALLIEDEPDEETRREEGLEPDETLLGLYRGIPRAERGSGYGVGGVLPDTITLYRLPIHEEAREVVLEKSFTGTFSDAVRFVVRETLWHEIGHYFGLDEHEVGERESGGTNFFNEKS